MSQRALCGENLVGKTPWSTRRDCDPLVRGYISVYSWQAAVRPEGESLLLAPQRYSLLGVGGAAVPVGPWGAGPSSMLFLAGGERHWDFRGNWLGLRLRHSDVSGEDPFWSFTFPVGDHVGDCPLCGFCWFLLVKYDAAGVTGYKESWLPCVLRWGFPFSFLL